MEGLETVTDLRESLKNCDEDDTTGKWDEAANFVRRKRNECAERLREFKNLLLARKLIDPDPEADREDEVHLRH